MKLSTSAFQKSLCQGHSWSKIAKKGHISIFSELGKKILVNLIPRAKRVAQGILVNIPPRAEREA